MTEPVVTYVPDPGDVDLVSRLLCAADGADPDACSEAAVGLHRMDAEGLLTALAATGRLLPTGGVERVEFAHKPGYLVHSHRCPNSELTRTVTKWPDGNEWLGPWVAVDEGSRTA